MCIVLAIVVVFGEYFRTFMVYGVIGVALGLHVWKANKKNRIIVE